MSEFLGFFDAQKVMNGECSPEDIENQEGSEKEENQNA